MYGQSWIGMLRHRVTGVHRLCMDGLGYFRTVLVTLVHAQGYIDCVWTVLDIPGLSW